MDEPESSAASAVRRFDKDRFEIELEFIQCLASPNYLYELASKGYLDDPCFLNYLEYLNYWRNPKYVQFILYPTSLHHLTLLQAAPAFRQALKNINFVDDMHNQEMASWDSGFATKVKGEDNQIPVPDDNNPPA